MARKLPDTSTPENHAPISVDQADWLREMLASVRANLDYSDFMGLVYSTTQLQGHAATELNYKLVTDMKNQVAGITMKFINKMKKVGYNTDKMIVRSKSYPVIDNVYFSMSGIKLFKQYVHNHPAVQKSVREVKDKFLKILNANYPYWCMGQ